MEREALIALVRWLGEQTSEGALRLNGDPFALPLGLHAQVREALGPDFYIDADEAQR